MSDRHHAVCAFDTRESSALSSPQARSHVLRRWPVSALCAAIASALPAAGFAPGARAQLEEVFVTAQRRELGLQDSALSIAAFSGQTLEQAQVFNTGDLAQQTSGISFTSISPFDMELNIRGVMNTRLDAPSASRSVGIFFDEVVVGRMGLMNMDFYDLERVEILRGPQGVLLGKNVVGGAISIITAKPEFTSSASVRAQAGNLDARLLSGHFNTAINDQLALRAAAQFRYNDGFAQNAITARPLHNIESRQARLSLRYAGDGDFSGGLIFEYMHDDGNGACAIGENGNPWAVARRVVGLTDIRSCVPEAVQYRNIPGDSRSFYTREAFNATLRLERGFDNAALISLTNYRSGEGESQFSQTGLGPDTPGLQSAFRNALAARNLALTQALGLAFDFPVREREDLKQFVQELRLVSDFADTAWDYIAGLYFQRDTVAKNDVFWGESLLGRGPLGGLNGESEWFNKATTDSWAVFGQAGYAIADNLKLTLGARYTEDRIDGFIAARVNATDDRFNPGEATPLVPLTGEPDGRGGLTPFSVGDAYATPYAESWGELTFSGTVEYHIGDAAMLYASVAQGYKSGGFQDTPANTPGATTAYDPETVLSIEAGLKSEFWNRRLRVNGAIFSMDYSDLQVEFTNDQCLCNIVSNVSDARIRGMEFETSLAATDALRLWLNGSLLDTEYENYAIRSGDFSGNPLQRTPETQVSTGFEYAMALGGWGEALKLRLSYTWQDKMPWAHTSVAFEEAYGLLDGRIGLSPENRNWSMALWARNLGDEESRVNVIEFLGGDISLYNPPRTYGVELAYRW